MTSPDIHRAEIERIFDKSGCTSATNPRSPSPATTSADRSRGGRLHVVRGVKTGNVHVFHNTCTHRGARGVPAGLGQLQVFQCFYHAWTFDSEGELAACPDEEGYAPGVDLEELGLRRVPRVESYRGFCSSASTPTSVDCATTSAGAKEYIDLVVDQCARAMEIVGGSHEYACNANWKLLVENSVDGYHAEPLHDTYFEYLRAIGTDLRGRCERTGHRPRQRPRGDRVHGTVGRVRSPSGSRCSARTPARNRGAPRGSGRAPRRASELGPWPR